MFLTYFFAVLCVASRLDSAMTLLHTIIFPILFFHLDAFLQVIKRSNQTPVEKFEFPQTEAQEIGWCTDPLVSVLYTTQGRIYS